MNRILVVLPNWFGETLFATPFLARLRSQQPGAFIATLGWPQCREVLLHNPQVNELLTYDERGTHRSLLAKWRLIGSLRAHRFDTAFVLRRSLSRSLLLALAGIPVRIGFANRKSGWLLTHRLPVLRPPSSEELRQAWDARQAGLPAPRIGDSESARQAGIRPSPAPMHKASTYLPLLEAIGIPIVTGPYDYTVSEEERRGARELLSQHAAVDEQPFIVLHPGANWTHKRWPPDRFAALGDRLAASHALAVVITGGPHDVELANSVKRRMRHPVAVLAGRTTLRQLAACLEPARLVVSNDTGVLHVAAALGRPVVALYGPTSPVLTGPLGDPQRTVVLHHPDCCPSVPCYRPDHPPHPGMDSISVEEVFEAATALLRQTAHRHDG